MRTHTKIPQQTRKFENWESSYGEMISLTTITICLTNSLKSQVNLLLVIKQCNFVLLFQLKKMTLSIRS